jgi:TRAP-type C4-dicarboxylate transport system permease small subunit
VLKTTKKILDRSLEILIMTTMAVLTLDVLWQVFTRFVLKNPSTWTEELATYLLIWVALLGSAVALNRGAHLGVDYLTGKMPVRIRLYTEVFVFLCIALFSLCVMIIGGMDIVISTLKLGQISPSLEIKVGYVYLALPISGFFLALYSAIGMIERLVELFSHITPQQKITPPEEQVGVY